MTRRYIEYGSPRARMTERLPAIPAIAPVLRPDLRGGDAFEELGGGEFVGIPGDGAVPLVVVFSLS